VVAKVSQLSAALHGSFFGVDVNPAANRLRIISITGRKTCGTTSMTPRPPAGQSSTRC
jgi:hypothetical protein